MRSERREPGRIATHVALAAGAYAAVLGLVTLVALTSDHGDDIVRRLDLEDLLFTIPVAGLVAVSSGVIALIRARSRRFLAVAAFSVGLLGLLAFALVLAVFVGAASVLDQL